MIKNLSTRVRRHFSAIPIIILLNIIVFLGWHFGEADGEPTWMINNFLVSWSALADARVWVLLTSAFSHNRLWHLLLNMLVLRNFGQHIEYILGTRRFLLFYVLSGIFSSFCHAFVSAFLLGQPELPALGASGAISALVLFFALLYPKEKLYLFALIPFPAIWGAAVFVGLDIWGLIAQSEGGGLPIGHGAHLGGALSGIIYYFFFFKKPTLILKERLNP